MEGLKRLGLEYRLPLGDVLEGLLALANDEFSNLKSPDERRRFRAIVKMHLLNAGRRGALLSEALEDLGDDTRR
jgi:hypothetical protein